MTGPFNTDQLDLLMAAAAWLMPDEGSLPSVEDAGLRETYIAQALLARPDGTPKLAEFLRLAEQDGVEEALEHCRDHRPELWEAVTTILPGAYFLSPQVRDALGYRGQTPQLIPTEGSPDYDEFLSGVLDRGPQYRPTPSQ
ncbi:hypothetical protein DDE18_16935 [Nocardioides gansuensis]|uniref:Gluconate 2-dehydrogenase subunit 3 family protein n=1 Tax=Nocardioides gansuensis TaxID=2138300 RepID=A0A2T8F7I3_9ACTN|nr:hypothetical protein [Nocardioides gansuensis]PVG81673.1 hypothetical protein DDE18_16935 [Nocardioides gansuensis]